MFCRKRSVEKSAVVGIAVHDDWGENCRGCFYKSDLFRPDGKARAKPVRWIGQRGRDGTSSFYRAVCFTQRKKKRLNVQQVDPSAGVKTASGKGVNGPIERSSKRLKYPPKMLHLEEEFGFY